MTRRTGSPLRALDSSRMPQMPLMRSSLTSSPISSARRLRVCWYGTSRDDDLAAAAFLDDLGAGAQRDLAAAGAVAVEDALPAADDAAGREVRAGNDLHQLERCVTSGSSMSADEAVADLAQVVRRNVGGHADGDAVGAVDEQVGELARQDERLAVLAVVVVDEIDGVAVEVGEHLGGDGREAGLGVPVGGGRQAGDGAEVALRRG